MADPYAKIGWAKEHLNTLERELGLFCGAAPPKAYTVTRQDDIEHGEHVIAMEFHDIPPKICLIAADAIYSMRAALDQTVWALASLTKIPGATQFPIIEDWNADGRKRFNRQIDGVPSAAVSVIQALQPYHAGNAFKGHHLWRLNEMCNLDRHRRIPAHGTAVQAMLTGVDLADVVSHTADNRIVYRLPLVLKDKARFNPGTPIEVTFGGDSKSGITETFADLRGIHNFVALNVLPRFDRFFT